MPEKRINGLRLQDINGNFYESFSKEYIYNKTRNEYIYNYAIPEIKNLIQKYWKNSFTDRLFIKYKYKLIKNKIKKIYY
jgi:hypothetical protein